ncbi:MAG: hypothetical protein HC828_02830 [Blastochloris sp.]|nr:hypothetical protein [Blastochloris sp.]
MTAMILMVSGATTTTARFVDHPALGRLVQPRSWNRVDTIARSGMPWGADNDALAGVKPDAYLRMLDAIARSPRDQLKFVAAPDAVERTAHGIHGSWRVRSGSGAAGGRPSSSVVCRRQLCFRTARHQTRYLGTSSPPCSSAPRRAGS